MFKIQKIVFASLCFIWTIMHFKALFVVQKWNRYNKIICLLAPTYHQHTRPIPVCTRTRDVGKDGGPPPLCHQFLTWVSCYDIFFTNVHMPDHRKLWVWFSAFQLWRNTSILLLKGATRILWASTTACVMWIFKKGATHQLILLSQVQVLGIPPVPWLKNFGLTPRHSSCWTPIKTESFLVKFWIIHISICKNVMWMVHHKFSRHC